VAGCLYGFRNIEGGIVLHLKYKNNRLTVAVGQRDTEMDQFFICASDVFVKLPERVYQKKHLVCLFAFVFNVFLKAFEFVCSDGRSF
jgi:hypothetical protein